MTDTSDTIRYGECCSRCGLHKKPFQPFPSGPIVQKDLLRPKVLFVYAPTLFCVKAKTCSTRFYLLTLAVFVASFLSCFYFLPSRNFVLESDEQLPEYKGLSVDTKVTSELRQNKPPSVVQKQFEDIPLKFERHKRVYRRLKEKFEQSVEFYSREDMNVSEMQEGKLREVHSEEFIDTLFIPDFHTFLPYTQAVQVQVLKHFFGKDWQTYNPNVSGNKSLTATYLSNELKKRQDGNGKPLLPKLKTALLKNTIKWTEFVDIKEYDERQLKWFDFFPGFENYSDFDSELKYTESEAVDWQAAKFPKENDLCEIVKRYCSLTYYCAERMAKPLHEDGVALAFNYAGGLHHARRQKGFGFCPANDIALAIRHWRDTEPTAKILYVDIDFHHGDGVEQIFYQDPQVVTFSTHGSASFPGTGCYADRFGNPTARSRPFWYDHKNGHLGDTKKPNATAQKKIEKRRADWLKDVKAELSELFEDHDFAYVILQSGVDSIVGGDGGGKLNLIIRPFLTAENHKDLASHVSRLSAQGGSKLLVLGGGGYDVGKAVDQWTEEFEAIKKTFAEHTREKAQVPATNKSDPIPVSKERKWDENASNQLARIKIEIENQEWFPQQPDPQDEDYKKLTDKEKRANDNLLIKIKTTFPKIKDWDDMPYFSDSIQKKVNTFFTKVPTLQSVAEVNQYVTKHFGNCIPDTGKSIHVAFKSEIVKHATKQLQKWARMALLPEV